VERTDMLAVSGRETENFCYDALARLTASTVGGTTSCTGGAVSSAAYDALGDITSKSGVGTYTYGAGAAGPHAVTSIAGTVNGVPSPTFTYDANGNMLTGAGRTVGYTSFNMAGSIADGTTSLALSYDPDHQRIQQIATVAGAATATIYLDDPASGTMNEAVVNSVQTWKTYILADGKIVALHSDTRRCGDRCCAGLPILNAPIGGRLRDLAERF
jgi:hypothetical protein